MMGMDAKPLTYPALAFAAFCALSLLCGCGKSAAQKADMERRAAAREKIAGLEDGLAALPDGPEKVERLRAILGIEVMNLGDLGPALERYAKNESLLSTDAQSRVYEAVAESMQAGREKKIENKLKWLMRGMGSFEALREEFPGDETVYLYQASTYANFPAEVGAKAQVLDILTDMRGRYAAGDWTLTDGTANQIEYVYSGLFRNFKDDASEKEIKAHRAEFASSIPAFASVAAANRESAE